MWKLLYLQRNIWWLSVKVCDSRRLHKGLASVSLCCQTCRVSPKKIYWCVFTLLIVVIAKSWKCIEHVLLQTLYIKEYKAQLEHKSRRFDLWLWNLGSSLRPSHPLRVSHFSNYYDAINDRVFDHTILISNLSLWNKWAWNVRPNRNTSIELLKQSDWDRILHNQIRRRHVWRHVAVNRS